MHVSYNRFAIGSFSYQLLAGNCNLSLWQHWCDGYKSHLHLSHSDTYDNAELTRSLAMGHNSLYYVKVNQNLVCDWALLYTRYLISDMVCNMPFYNLLDKDVSHLIYKRSILLLNGLVSLSKLVVLMNGYWTLNYNVTSAILIFGSFHDKL